VFRAGEALRTARRVAGLSVRDLAEMSGRPVSTISRIERGAVAPSVSLLDELLRICGLRLAVVELESDRRSPARRQPLIVDSMETDGLEDQMLSPPIERNDRGDNPWDEDTVQWLLDHPDVSARFRRGPLFECLRRQPNRLRNQPHRVKEAADLARKYGVIQREVYDPTIGKTVVRLIRTDQEAPDYPW
jgi:transcriptional regulator with XRE-family HTH domain